MRHRDPIADVTETLFVVVAYFLAPEQLRDHDEARGGGPDMVARRCKVCASECNRAARATTIRIQIWAAIDLALASPMISTVARSARCLASLARIGAVAQAGHRGEPRIRPPGNLPLLRLSRG